MTWRRGCRPRTRAAATMLVTVALTGVAVLGVGCSPETSYRSSSPQPAPPLRGPDLDGDVVDLAAHRGAVVVVTAWASWCGVCADQVPVLEQAMRLPGPVRVIGLNTFDDPEAARSAARRRGVDFPSILDRDGRMAVEWGLRGVPETFVIDPDGTVVDRRSGPLPDEWLATVRSATRTS